jgi:CheY-like chemotaxis protein
MCKEILIVEDDPDIRESLQIVLETEGYHACTASNGKEAMAALEILDQPCLVLLDLMMPVMNGWEFLAVQRQNDRLAKVPVVVVSAIADGARPAGAIEFMQKPVDLDALLQLVRNHCAD